MRKPATSIGLVAILLGASAPALAAQAEIPALSAGAYKLENRSPGALSNTEFLRVPGDKGPGPVLQDAKRPYKHMANRTASPTFRLSVTFSPGPNSS